MAGIPQFLSWPSGGGVESESGAGGEPAKVQSLVFEVNKEGELLVEALVEVHPEQIIEEPGTERVAPNFSNRGRCPNDNKFSSKGSSGDSTSRIFFPNSSSVLKYA